MSDGAHQGVTAGRALKTILGGEPEPEKEEQQDKSTFCAWVRAAPDTLDGFADDDAYSEVCRILAKLLLLYWAEKPEAIGTDCHEELKARFPDSAETITGISGFMWGWSVNAARHCSELPRVPNPAIVTIEVPDEADAGAKHA